MLEEIIGKSWVPVLEGEFQKEYLQKLARWITYQRISKTIYPDSEDVFKALRLCPYGQVKVIILGQNPYPNGQADGLAFSFKNGAAKEDLKQALHVIIDEIEKDCYDGFNPTHDYDLSYLAKQGVLLLNSSLTVERNNPNSHLNIGWEKFIKVIIDNQLNEKSPKVFMLWGKEAQSALYQPDHVRRENDSLMGHLILNTYHPASDLYNRDQFGRITKVYPEGFTGCKHFSQANNFLLKHQLSAINWLPVEEPYFNKRLDEEPPF